MGDRMDFFNVAAGKRALPLQLPRPYLVLRAASSRGFR